MSSGTPHQQQLELFDFSAHPRPKPRSRYPLGRLWVSARYDQLLLLGIAGLIGLTVVFACGVERGKHVARAQPRLLPAQDATAGRGEARPSESAATRVPSTSVTPPQALPAKTKASPVPRALGEPSKPVKGRSRYAVQVVSYRTPQLAKEELGRLQSAGERAFLILRGGYAVLYVGPFPSKEHAQEKLPGLRTRYHGCFVKSL